MVSERGDEAENDDWVRKVAECWAEEEEESESNSWEEKEGGFSSAGESEAGAEEEGDLCSVEGGRDSVSSVSWHRREKREGQASVKKSDAVACQALMLRFITWDRIMVLPMVTVGASWPHNKTALARLTSSIVPGAGV